MPRKLLGSTTVEKLLRNHVVDGDCWRWTGAHTPTGYGQLVAAGKRASVHRLAHTLWIGPIPDGHEVDHLCRVRDCINPAHLEAVTHFVNVQRQRRRQPKYPPACAQGHQFTPENTYMRKGRPSRGCRTCHNSSNRRYRAGKRDINA